MKLAKTVLFFAPIVENIVLTVIRIFAKVVGLVTSAQVVKEVFVITAIFARIVR